VLSNGFLLLPFSPVGVAVFAIAVVTLDPTVAAIPAAIEHKERAAGEFLIPESP